jgi:hypothetical protein
MAKVSRAEKVSSLEDAISSVDEDKTVSAVVPQAV